MKIVLLHNTGAGGGGHPPEEQIVRHLEKAGHDVIYQTTTEQGAKWTLLEEADAVIAAGGDGTVRKAALGIVGRNVPLAILPLGTANNLARIFGGFPPDSEQFRTLSNVRKVRLDVAMASSSWGESPFIESAGTGLLARLMFELSRARSEKAPSVEQALAALQKLVGTCPGRLCNLLIDGRRFTEKLLMVEAMNTCTVGPNLKLAHDADPGDGRLDFVFLKEANRSAFADYLNNFERKQPPVEIVRGESLSFEFDGPAHADDLIWPPKNVNSELTETKALEIHLLGKPIELLVPGKRKLTTNEH